MVAQLCPSTLSMCRLLHVLWDPLLCVLLLRLLRLLRLLLLVLWSLGREPLRHLHLMDLLLLS